MRAAKSKSQLFQLVFLAGIIIALLWLTTLSTLHASVPLTSQPAVAAIIEPTEENVTRPITVLRVVYTRVNSS